MHTKEQFVSLLDSLAVSLHAVDIDASDASAQASKAAALSSPKVAAVREAAVAALDSDWLVPKENGNIRYGRIARDVQGFSVDAVLMDGPGPRHRHPNGELDLCFALEGDPKFDGHPEGWVVYRRDSVHVPTVTGGKMLILYFLPGGAIDFL